MGDVPLKEYVVTLIDEREKLHMAKVDALSQRVLDWKNAAETALSLARSEAQNSAKKLEEALLTYKANVNEWQSTFREFKDDNLSRGETLATFKELRGLVEAVDQRVSALQNQMSRGEGGNQALAGAKTQANWLIGLVIMSGLTMLGLVVNVLFNILKR